MKWPTFGAAILLCLSTASCTPNSPKEAFYRRYDYDPFQARDLAARQEDQRCGAENNGQICPGQSCCSMYGWCGEGPEYCNRFSCQTEYGWCDGEPIPTAEPEPEPEPTTEPEPEPTAEPEPEPSGEPTGDPTEEPGTGETSEPVPPELVISEDGLCGNVTTCAGSAFGRCCSNFYWCGNDETYCGDGCREEFGGCGEEPEESEPVETEEPPTETGETPTETGEPPTETEEPPTETEEPPTETEEPPTETEEPPTETEEPEPEPTETGEPEPTSPPQTELVISSDGMCGNGTTCAGSDFGGCCSWYFWCGEGDSYCGDRCRGEFGSCDEPETGEPPQAELEISTNGMCGNGTTCAGSEFGGCCSWWFWCGDGNDFCTGDCRSEFGECGGAV